MKICSSQVALISQVGLRWWNFINDEGKSEWKFESRNSNDSTRCVDKNLIRHLLDFIQYIIMSRPVAPTTRWEVERLASSGADL